MRSIVALGCGALALSVGAFELGQSDANVYTLKANRADAQELSSCLEKVFGKKYPVKVVEKGAGDRDPAGIFVGLMPLGYQATWDVMRDCNVCVVEKDRVWLFGNDGKDVHGTANAVYDFLERYAGVRWLWPGELGTVADPQAPVTVPEGTTTYVPPFQRRLTSSFHYGQRALTPAEGRDLNVWLRHRRVGSSLQAVGSGCGHAFASLLPRDRYGKDHPDFFPLISPEHWLGEPKPTKPTRISDPMMPNGYQLCTSNPEVRRLIARKIVDAKTDRIQSISPNDGAGFCECDACRAQDPEGQGIFATSAKLCDRMFNFVEDVAKQVYAESPTSKIGFFSYSYYSDAPVREYHLPPNVYLSCCYFIGRMDSKEEAALTEKLTALARTGGQIIGREYWGTHYTMRYPLSHSRKIDRNLKLLHKLGAAGIYGEPGNSFGPRASDLYLLALLSWDPTANREAALHDFCDKAFGPKAGAVMYDLFESVEDWVEKGVEGLPNNHGRAFRHYNWAGYAEINRAMTTIFSPEFSAMCEKKLAKARKLAEKPVWKDRIGYIATGLEFAKLTTESLQSLGELAAAGVNLPLTMPSDTELVMEKKTLIKAAKRAIAAERRRQAYPTVCEQSNVLVGDLRSEAMDLRPWRALSELALLHLQADRYNYLVNGAFEYAGYSWDVAGAGTNFITRAHNHDNDDNVMVQCHLNQGISMQLEIAPGGTMTLRNLRKISPDEPRSARLKMFVRVAGDPTEFLKVTFGGRVLKGFDASRDVPESDGWHELKYQPVNVPAGEHEFVITVTNPGTTPLVLNFDDLDLRLGGVVEP